MKKTIIVLSIITIILSLNKEQKIIIPKDSIRFRVIANSNTIYDQNIKIMVKNAVQNKIFELIKEKETIEETRTTIKDNMNLIENVVKDTLNTLDYDKDYNINYGYNHFLKKSIKE